jgi:hypothetical protein
MGVKELSDMWHRTSSEPAAVPHFPQGNVADASIVTQVPAPTTPAPTTPKAGFRGRKSIPDGRYTEEKKQDFSRLSLAGNRLLQDQKAVE